ncbi:hypothetical protein HRbin01_00018 [archaeon HR01]|nr:hypothetical protein HRbin01_00018 [archaeon HR01]
MSDLCKWLHEQLPENGIYFFYEKGEIWGHGGDKPRIVRIATHREGNFRSRIGKHYLLNESWMNFDRSIFRYIIGKRI